MARHCRNTWLSVQFNKRSTVTDGYVLTDNYVKILWNTITIQSRYSSGLSFAVPEAGETE